MVAYRCSVVHQIGFFYFPFHVVFIPIVVDVKFAKTSLTVEM